MTDVGTTAEPAMINKPELEQLLLVALAESSTNSTTTRFKPTNAN
jgi:hypothetical protein